MHLAFVDLLHAVARQIPTDSCQDLNSVHVHVRVCMWVQYTESDQEQSNGAVRPSKTTTSLADITNSPYDKPTTHMAKKVTDKQ